MATVALDSGGTDVYNAPVYSGAFGHDYLTSQAGTGEMYVCGKSGNQDQARLHRVSISSGTMNNASDGSINLSGASAAQGCSPVTVFYNASTGMDWLFVSVGNGSITPPGSTCSATTGCVMSLNVTGTAWPPTAMNAGYVMPNSAGNSSSSGIIVDNAAGTTTVAKTSLSAAITGTVSPLAINVAAAAGFAVNDYLQIDAERMQITEIAGNQLTVARGGAIGTAATHLINTAVVSLRFTRVATATGTAGSITVDSTTAFNVGDFIQIDNEAMVITGITGSVR